jgi:hypothetical protein
VGKRELKVGKRELKVGRRGLNVGGGASKVEEREEGQDKWREKEEQDAIYTRSSESLKSRSAKGDTAPTVWEWGAQVKE